MSKASAEKRSAVLPVEACHDPEGYLFEVAWEVCQQLGGIYTVIRSKIPSMIERWGERYCLVGPYNPATAAIEFNEDEPPKFLRPALQALRARGYQVHFGHWLVTGRPQVILLDVRSAMSRLIEFKYFFGNITRSACRRMIARLMKFWPLD